MKQFEVGKSYRTFNNKTYTVTKRTEAFVTFTDASGTKTFRRKPYEHSNGYEWTEGPNIGGYRISAVEEVKEQSTASVVVSMQPDVQPEEIAAPKADATKTQKGRKTMTKLTTEQAVTAVQSATTAKEVHAVLEQCKKDQLHEVVLAVTGDKHWLSPKSRTKAELVHSYTWGIMRHKEDEEFKSKPFEKKYEALMDCSKYLQRIEYICLFSAEEVNAAAERLGLSYDCSHCSLADAVLRELRIRDKVQFVTECTKAKDVRLLKDALIDADFGGIAKEAFSRLIAQLGLAMDEAASKDTLKMGELLYRHYTESKELVAEATCNPDVQEASVIVDDIPADHKPDVQEEKTVEPAKFIIGRHYQSRGLDKGTVTFLGKVSRDCGYFVDSLNCYHRVKIKTDSTGEYASISHKCGSFPADRISAAHEVLEHEIISVANGTSILLDAENVIHSYQELEAKLAPKPAPAKPEHQQKNSKPETRKPRHAKKIDESRQVFIQFDEPETHAPASTPAKPKVRRTRKPRVKKDYSRQILIDFGENIPDGQTNQRKAA